MRILLGHCFYRSSAPSGEDAVYRNEKKLLEDSGLSVIPYELFNDDIIADTFSQKMRVGLDTGWSDISHKKILTIIRETKPDIAHFHNIFPQLSPSVYYACKDAGVPIVQTLHNYRYICPNGLLMHDGKPCESCVGGNLLHAMVHRCYRDSYLATLPLIRMILKNRKNGAFDLVDQYICLTEFAKSRFVSAGFPSHKITVKPNFLDCQKITDQSDDLDINADYYVYAGRLKEEKGIHTLVETWCNGDLAELRVLGDGELMQPLREQAERAGANIRFYGFVESSELLKHIKGAKAVIIPSICYEGFPMAVLEAFSQGVPVIASDIGSLGSIIEHGINGYKFEPGNPESIQNAVIDFESSSNHEQLKSHIKTEFLNLYTPENNVKILRQIYRSIIG